MKDSPPYAVLAEFDDPDRLLAAAKALRAKGFENIEAFTPFPVTGLAEAIGFSDGRIALSTLIGGILGGIAGFGMQVGTNLDYPLWVGGRAPVSVPEFVVVTCELLLLGAALGAIGSMLVLNRLPRLNHPVFDADGFGLGDDDRFFLAILNRDGFDREEAGKALAELHPKAIIEVPGGPE